MKKHHYIAIILVLIFKCSIAQDLKTEISIGAGTYYMKDLKYLNDIALKRLAFDAKITDDFPMTPYYSVSLIPIFDFFLNVGIFGSYYSTGSRIHYKDYSGEYTYDNLIKSYNPGVTIRIKLVDKKVLLKQYNNVSYSFTSLKIKEDIRVSEIESSEEIEFKAKSFLVESGLKLDYTFYKSIGVGMNIGYLLDFRDIFYLKGNEDAILVENEYSDRKIQSNWSGIRIGFTLFYIIN